MTFQCFDGGIIPLLSSLCCLSVFAPITHGLNVDQLQATEVRVSHVIHNVNFMLSETVWQVLPHFTSANQSAG